MKRGKRLVSLEYQEPRGGRGLLWPGPGLLGGDVQADGGCEGGERQLGCFKRDLDSCWRGSHASEISSKLQDRG